jgi:hypothetical protein
MQYFYSDWTLPIRSLGQSYNGSNPTCQTVFSTYESALLLRHQAQWCGGIPHGSVLGAILFLLYCGDLQRIIESHGLRPHLCADDSQIYGFCRPSAYPELQMRISASIDDVAGWMRLNRLQLNSAKTDILCLTTSHRLHQLPRTPLRVGADFVVPSTVVRDLGIPTDSDVSMRSHVTRTVSTCFAVLRLLRTIRRSVSRTVIQSLITSLVLSRLVYGNTTLADA